MFHSGTDVVSLKRQASTSENLLETKVRRTSGGRPKTADYDESVKALIISAISYYRANLSSVRAFPDLATEQLMLSEVWKFVCNRVKAMASITPQIAKLVKSILSTCSLTFIFTRLRAAVPSFVENSSRRLVLLSKVFLALKVE